MEVVVVNYVLLGDRVFVVIIGVFGKCFVDLVNVYGGEAKELVFEFGIVVDPNQVDDVLVEDFVICVVLIQYNEIFIGVMNIYLLEIVTVVCNWDCLLIVDVISLLSSILCLVDEWDLDVVVSGV